MLKQVLIQLKTFGILVHPPDRDLTLDVPSEDCQSLCDRSGEAVTTSLLFSTDGYLFILFMIRLHNKKCPEIVDTELLFQSIRCQFSALNNK